MAFGMHARKQQAPTHSLALVEVRKTDVSTIWHDAILRDIILDKAWLAFDRGVWPSREVPCEVVRARAPLVQLTNFTVGSKVEVRFPSTEQSPASWALASISPQDSGREGYISVNLQSHKSTSKEVIVPTSSLRPVSEIPAIDPLVLCRRAVPIDDDLLTWLSMPDARGCLEQVRAETGLHLAIPGYISPNFSIEADALQELDAAVLVGDEAATHKGEMLLKVHLLHQREVEAFHKRRTRKLAMLQELESKGAGADARASFMVDAELVGRTCGKGGERVKKVERDYGVEIRIADGSEEGAPKTILIHCDDGDAADQARQELELTRREYEVPEDRLEWFQANQTLQGIVKKAGLAFTSWKGSSLELCGDRDSLETAVLLLDSHNEYFCVFQEIGRQQDEIQRSFEKLEVDAEAVGLGPSSRVRRPSKKRDGQSSQNRSWSSKNGQRTTAGKVAPDEGKHEDAALARSWHKGQGYEHSDD